MDAQSSSSVGSEAGARRVDRLLSEYGASHRHSANKRLHWICVPIIVWCALALLWTLPFPEQRHAWLNWATLVALASLFYYSRLSLPLAAGAALLLVAMLLAVYAVATAAPGPLWLWALVLFVLAWIGQFIGHHIEGKRPSFFKDLQFLLIGPLWLLAHLYRRLGIAY